MASKQGQIVQILEPIITAMGYEYVGCEFFNQGHRSLLRIYIDSVSGIGLQDCERVSRQVSAVLDVEDPIRGKYVLEISSPGLERPLFTPEHFQRFIGHKAKVKLHLAQDGRRNFTGIIQVVAEGQLQLDMDGQMVNLLLANIDKANLVPN